MNNWDRKTFLIFSFAALCRDLQKCSSVNITSFISPFWKRWRNRSCSLFICGLQPGEIDYSRGQDLIGGKKLNTANVTFLWVQRSCPLPDAWLPVAWHPLYVYHHSSDRRSLYSPLRHVSSESRLDYVHVCLFVVCLRIGRTSGKDWIEPRCDADYYLYWIHKF